MTLGITLSMIISLLSSHVATATRNDLTSFEDFPWFEEAPVDKVLDIEWASADHFAGLSSILTWAFLGDLIRGFRSPIIICFPWGMSFISALSSSYMFIPYSKSSMYEATATSLFEALGVN